MADCLLVDSDAVVILEVFQKKSEQTPQSVIKNCQRRLSLYEKSLR
jgi:phage-related protein